MGLRLVRVQERQPGFGGGQAAARAVLHQEALAAEQVREAVPQPVPVPVPVLTCLRCRFLHYCLDPDKIRKQDAISTIVSISNNAVGQPLAWDFVRAKWDDIVA